MVIQALLDTGIWAESSNVYLSEKRKECQLTLLKFAIETEMFFLTSREE